MTIVRVGLAETKNYGTGWDSIFGKGKKTKGERTVTVAKKKTKRARKRK